MGFGIPKATNWLTRRIRRNRIAMYTVTAVCVVLVGVLAVHHVVRQHEMTEVAHSVKVRNGIHKMLKRTEPNAFSEDGVIQSFAIKDKSIRSGPAGDIDLTVYVNGDESMFIPVAIYEVNIEDRTVIQVVPGDPSAELARRIRYERSAEDSPDTGNSGNARTSSTSQIGYEGTAQ